MEKEKKILAWTLPILAIALPLNLAIGVWKHSHTNAEADAQLRKFNTVVNVIREHYVDETKVGYSELVDGALSGMLQSLDRHSHYLDKEAFDSAQERMAGQFAGIGITYTKGDEGFTVHNVLPGGPAAKAGLKPNDRIRFVDGKELAGHDLKEASKLLKGEKGASVRLGINRGDEDLEVELVRDLIKLPTVSGVRVLKEDILYFHVTQFNVRTESEVAQTLAKHSKAKGVIMDLRHNPGGLLTSAQNICSFFLSPFNDKGGRRVVVSITPRDQTKEATRFVEPQKVTYMKLPVVILVNGQSASASEIVAGCLKDYGRATLVGTKTFGKGSVQQERPLGDGTAIRITTAKYYTPSRTVIHERGIEPHVTIPMPPAEERAALSLIGSDVSEKDLLQRDAQLAKAYEILRGVAP